MPNEWEKRGGVKIIPLHAGQLATSIVLGKPCSLIFRFKRDAGKRLLGVLS